MKIDKIMHCDLLVIGAGLAGMTAAARAAHKGLDAIVAGNPSSFAFSSGLLDYLGVYPAESSELLKRPELGMNALTSDLPGHAYTLCGHNKVIESFEFVKTLLDRAGLPYTMHRAGSGMENKNFITAMGTLKPSFMIPETMTAGSLAVDQEKSNKRLLVAGIKGLSGFSAAQVAQGVRKYFADTRHVDISLPGVATGIQPQIMAELMESVDIKSAFIEQLAVHIGDADLCGLPGICGINNSPAIVDEMSTRLGVKVFEIPGSPPSVPGMRMAFAFEKVLGRSGVRMLSNVRIKDPVFDGKKFKLTAGSHPDEITIRTNGVILATGRFFGNGLHARRERIVETVFYLNVAQPTGRHLWHDTKFLNPNGHAINLAGIETDSVFRPLDPRGRPVYKSLYAVGSILAHNDWARLKSGAGASLASAISAVDHFVESGGSHGR